MNRKLAILLLVGAPVLASAEQSLDPPAAGMGREKSVEDPGSESDSGRIALGAAPVQLAVMITFLALIAGLLVHWSGDTSGREVRSGKPQGASSDRGAFSPDLP